MHKCAFTRLELALYRDYQVRLEGKWLEDRSAVVEANKFYSDITASNRKAAIVSSGRGWAVGGEGRTSEVAE
jgi:hypothetical protein